MVVGLLAILKAGGAYLPLDPAYPPARLRQVLDDAAPRLLLADAAGRSALGDDALARSDAWWIWRRPRRSGQTCRRRIRTRVRSASPHAISPM
ncbi:AMP-binding protein [Bradyrhizobium sp. BR 1432]|uniref:AMP-binding protein n=1 Tax=Bradyrhizobium sp. BR 1432 TaxID=3447966 RepID=UPI003EE7B51B